jgi:hypothetical protein
MGLVAAQSEQEALSGGKTYALGSTFHYLEKRLSDTKIRRPKPHAWRAPQ